MSTTPQLARRAPDPDAEILRRVLSGETALYALLIRRYNQRLFRIARAVLRDDAEVEDVMQEAYLRAYANLPRFQGRSLFSTWLTRILINCALAHLRARARRSEVALEAAQREGEVEDAAAAAAAQREELRAAQAQVSAVLEQTVDVLPPRYRVVFVMRELEGMSVAETSAALGLSPANTRVRLHRAKLLLREELRSRLPDLSVYPFLGRRCETFTARVMARVAALSGERAVRLPHAQVVHETGPQVRAEDQQDSAAG